MKKGAAIAAVLGVLLGVWGYWFYSRPYDAVGSFSVCRKTGLCTST